MSFDTGYIPATSKNIQGIIRKIGNRSVEQRLRGMVKRVAFCRVCEGYISEENKLNQGPRRHILMHHLRCPLYCCPHCPMTSHYDKFRLVRHIQRKHPGLQGEIIVQEEQFAAEEAMWYKRCFGRKKKAMSCRRTLPSLIEELGSETKVAEAISTVSRRSRSLKFSIDEILAKPPKSPSPQLAKDLLTVMNNRLISRRICYN